VTLASGLLQFDFGLARFRHAEHSPRGSKSRALINTSNGKEGEQQGRQEFPTNSMEIA
jgi:hypothetical protein